MRIRPQLIAVMAAVLAPLVLAAIGFSLVLADAQRELQMQGILERVRALRLLLDHEIDGDIRLLRIQADRADLARPGPPDAATLRDLLERVMRHQSAWSALLVVERDGTEIARRERETDSGPVPALDERTLRQALQTRTAAVSALVSTADGRERVTFIAVPVLAGGQPLRVLAVAISHRHWLALLRGHPMGEGATLSLVDQDGRLVMRTLNPQRWVGQPAAAQFLRRAASAPEGAFVTEGLEGQRFYTAFNRLADAPWMLATGLPAEVAEAPLHEQLRILAAGMLLAGLIAAAMVVVLRRRILAALQSLADVSFLRDPDGETVPPALPIEEAAHVRARLRETLLGESTARAEAEAARAEAETARTEAETARAQADAANRSKDDFLAMMAHELRNPLSAMATAVALLDAPHATPASNQHARDVLRRQVQRMTRLVDDLLDTARVVRGAVVLQLAPVDLAQLVRDVVATFQSGGRLKALQLEVALQPAQVQGDAMRLEQVVANLLDNAAKFTPPGGHLRLDLRPADGHAELSFSDDGIGMDAGLLARLFDPYTQAEPGNDKGRGGLGLGLHVVRRLVELHGGEVVAHSDGLGRGARFTVRLPLSDAAAPPPQQRQAGSLPPLRVVLVEDNPDGRESVAELLTMAGHEVLTAADGEAGLALLRRETPDVALVDMGLPLLDGLGVARGLRPQGHAGPKPPGLLFALTAYGDERRRADAREAGFDGFLLKPFDLREFEISVLEARKRQAAG